MSKEQEKEDTREEREKKPFEIVKGAEYRPPPDRDDKPPPPMPRSDEESDED